MNLELYYNITLSYIPLYKINRREREKERERRASLDEGGNTGIIDKR